MRVPVSLAVVSLLAAAIPACPQVISSATITASSASLTINMLPPPQLKMPTSESARIAAPYSGRQVSTTVQIHPDGTRGPVPGLINPNEETVTYRDSMGRVRTERPGVITTQIPSFRIITIRDPIGGYLYFLDVANHVAHRMALPAGGPKPTPTPAPVPMQVTTESAGPGITVTVQPLGTSELSGVKIAGRRTTTVYGPESQTGKDHPVSTVSEMWTAPSLGIVVSSKSLSLTDVERAMKMEDFHATEPDPALFQVPAGYRTEDETSPFTIVIPR